MAVKSIVTSHPEVSCEICERRLLRGERPEAFLAADSVCVVCELCVPRARAAGWSRVQEAAEGWEIRDAGTRSGSLIPGVFGRLRSWRSGRMQAQDELQPAALANAEEPAQSYGRRQSQLIDPAPAGAESDGSARTPRPMPAEPPAEPPAEARPGFDEFDTATHPRRRSAAVAHAQRAETAPLDGDLLEALEHFNRGTQTKRIQSVASTLGAPTLTLRRGRSSGSTGAAGDATAARHSGGESFVLSAAWELCWYRWRVDPADAGSDAELIDQGYELSDLDPADLLGNCQLDRRGLLQPIDG